MSRQVTGNALLARVEDYIGAELQEVERIFAHELESFHPFVTDILSHVSRFRGKRLRPMLLLLSAAAIDEINHDHLVLAAVIEMIHTATLVHDDVLDDAETRRHLATVNVRWTNETSVLFGDYLFTHAFHLASSRKTTYACRVIGRSTNTVCEGELAQIHESGNLHLIEKDYLRIIGAKTAELCSVSCRLGAHYAHASDAVVESLAEFGRALGMAFQIADDLLDVFGDEKETGKSLGSDLKKQKLTLPLIRLLSQLNEADAGRLRELLADPDERTAEQVSPFLEQSDAIDYSVNRANQFAELAREQLLDLDDSDAKQILVELAEFATRRSF